MKLQRIAALSALPIALAACQHAPSSGAMTGAAEAGGRILVHGGLRGPSASFTGDRVIGPAINMARSPDGYWVGWIRDVALNLSVTGGQISSPSLVMNIQELPQGVEVSGLWTEGPARGDQISIRVTPKELYVQGPFVHPPIFLEGIGQGSYGTGRYGNSVELKGTAGWLHPPQPQFALAVLGAF